MNTKINNIKDKKKKPGPPPMQLPSPETLMEMATLGLNKQQIAYSLAMSYETFKKRLKESPAHDIAYRKGKVLGIQKVANALFDNAIGNNNFNAQAFYLRCKGKWNDRVQVQHNHTHSNARDESNSIAQDYADAKDR
jgi:hypothetical protein